MLKNGEIITSLFTNQIVKKSVAQSAICINHCGAPIGIIILIIAASFFKDASSYLRQRKDM